MELTEEQRIDCWKQRAHKVSWKNIAKPFHVTGQTLRYALNPEADQIRKTRKRARYRAMQLARRREVIRERVHFEIIHKFPISNDILEERDRRQAIPYPDFTSEFFGDPRPGYSALDKKRAQGLMK